MPGRIEREGALDDDTARNIPQLIVAHIREGPRMGSQDQRLPVEAGQMASETERTLDAAAPCERREVKGGHQHSFHESTVSDAGISISVSPAISANRGSRGATAWDRSS